MGWLSTVVGVYWNTNLETPQPPPLSPPQLGAAYRTIHLVLSNVGGKQVWVQHVHHRVSRLVLVLTLTGIAQCQLMLQLDIHRAIHQNPLQVKVQMPHLLCPQNHPIKLVCPQNHPIKLVTAGKHASTLCGIVSWVHLGFIGEKFLVGGWYVLWKLKLTLC